MKPGASAYVGHYVRAVYDFETTHPKEINVKKGDIIKVTKNVDSNWLHGINRNVEGNFPASFVEKITLTCVSQGHKVFGAIENFPAQQDGDLEFRKGCIIEGTGKIDDNWWQGKIGTQTGIFPITHVMELEVPQELQDRSASVHSSEPMFARALCDSVAQLDEELGFHTGDMVTVTEIIDDDWYYGELGNKKGMFLAACVELIQDTYSASHSKANNTSSAGHENVLTRQSAVDQSKLTSEQDFEDEENKFSDINENLDNQNDSYIYDETEYNTQFSYTNENTKSLDSCVSPYGMTLYQFVAESPNELSFNANEIVYLIQHVDSQWIEGQIDDKIGIFPANFVSIVVDCPYAYDIDSAITEPNKNINENNVTQSDSSTVQSKSESVHCDSGDSHFNKKSRSENDLQSINKCNNKMGRNNELSAPDQYGLVLYDFAGEVDSDLTVFAGETVVIVKDIDSNWVQARNDNGQLGMVPKQFLDIVNDFSDSPENKVDSHVNTFQSESNTCDKNLKDKKYAFTDTLNTSTNIKLKEEKVQSDIKYSDSSNDKLKTDNVPVYTPCSKTGSFKKPALPSKPKPNLAPKPILKPKPLLNTTLANNLEERTGNAKGVQEPKLQKSLSFHDESNFHKSSSANRLYTVKEVPDKMSRSSSTDQIARASKDIENGRNNHRKDFTNQSLKAFDSVDSMIKSEMKKEIQKSDHGPHAETDNSKRENAEFSVSFNKSNQIGINKRHSVNFPLSHTRTNDFNTSKNEEPSLKVGYSTFFSDSSTDEVAPVRPKPMRKPPPPPQKTDTVDFSRKPSLRKPPPPRPSVPKDRPLSPLRTEKGSVTLNKSKRNDRLRKTDSKQPRAHIKPTRPAPQRPPPGQMPKQPLSPQVCKQSDSLMSFSPTSEVQAEDTNFEVIEDLKQRIKEVESDLQKYKKSKEELELNTGKDPDTYDNIEFYTANIEGLTQELDSLRENLHKLLPSSELDAVAKQMEEEERQKEVEKRREEDKKKAEEARIKRREKREKVIEELIHTERDYLHGLHLCIATFLTPSEDKAPVIDIEVVFGNIEDVADISQRLLTLLENAVSGKDFEDQIIGPCFTQLCGDMKDAYAPYCRNHDEVISMLEKYKEDKAIQQYINEKLNKLREEIVVFDLEALLIKPVQRILKYPLLLNELIKSTEDSHKDKVEILNGINAMTDVAACINEYKRRKDLVFKYKRETDQSIGDMIAKINLHSLKKKGSRWKGKLSTNLGIAPQTKDEGFDKEEMKFREMERIVRIFAKDVQTYIDQLQDAYSCHEGVIVDLMDFYDDKACPEFRKYQELYKVIQDKYLPEFLSSVREIVIVPLGKLMVFFDGPNKVIQKRYDKLLDYDSWQRKEEKVSEKSLQAAKITYEALNAQLLDELPKMYSLSFKLLKDCIGTFVQAQRKFYSDIIDTMTNTIDMSFLLETDGTVVDVFNINHVAIVDKMSVLRIIPKGFNPKMDVLAKPTSVKPTDRKSKRMSVDAATLSPSTISASTQSDSQKVYLQQKYPPDKVYQVTKSYTASDLMDLSITEGTCVGIVMDKDPMGNKDRWFVDNGAMKGFVPKSVLKPYSHGQTESKNKSLYPSMPSELISDLASDTPQISITDTSKSRDTQQSDVTTNVIGQKSPQSSPQLSVRPTFLGDLSTKSNDDDDLDFALGEDMSPNISTEEEFYYAKYGFTARNSNELSLFEGQVVTVLNKHDQENNPEWWFVDADGVKGYAPANYLQPM